MKNLVRLTAVPVLAALFALGLASHASAQGNPTITVDENGHGSLLFPGGMPIPTHGVLAPDPGPGGHNMALTYNLLGPPSLVAGDVFLMEPGTNGVDSDLIRFNPAGTGNPGYPASLVFYSDIEEGEINGDLADDHFPDAGYTNAISVFETGSEGNNGYVYTPTANQPGFVPGFAVTYNIISDTTVVPEPGSLALLATGGLPLLGFLRRRRV